MEVTDTAIEDAIRYAIRAAQCRAVALTDKPSAEAWEGTAEWCSEKSGAAVRRYGQALEARERLQVLR